MLYKATMVYAIVSFVYDACLFVLVKTELLFTFIVYFMVVSRGFCLCFSVLDWCGRVLLK